MNSHHHPRHEHHDVHHQRQLLWFLSFCNQRSSSSSSSSGSSTRRGGSGRRKSTSKMNKFALQYQQQLQQQQRQSSNVFGCDLIEHTSTFSEPDSIPHIVKSCTRFIEKHGIIFGIYRLSGMRINILKLRQDFDKNPKISMIDSEAVSNDAHAVACVLKQYFRELPTPLLTFHMYERFIELFKHSNNGTNNNDTSNNNNHNINATSGSDSIGQDSSSAIIENKEDMFSGDMSAIVGKGKPNYQQKSSEAIAIRKQQQITSSTSDSQLISLSSVVTTTTSDIKYQVRLDDLKRLLLQLPRAHYQTLKFLMRHLACIAANGEKTGMDSKNVAIVWAPNLLKPRELELKAGLETLQVIGLQAVITEQMIKHHKFLFDDKDPPSNTDSNNVATTNTLTDNKDGSSHKPDIHQIDEDVSLNHHHHHSQIEHNYLNNQQSREYEPIDMDQQDQQLRPNSSNSSLSISSNHQESGNIIAGNNEGQTKDGSDETRKLQVTR